MSSSPGAGETVPVAPTEIRLVFSEPVEPRYTSLDLLDPVGKAILVGAGAPDPADPRVLVAPIPDGTSLADGVYTVNWRALSAADGHATDGFVTFGLGAAAAGGHGGHDGTTSSGGSGGLHSGHSGGAAIAEIQGKVLAYGGTMLAFGLAILGWLVLRPALGRVPRATAWGIATGLIAAAAGCLLLLAIGASSLSGGSGSDYIGFALGSRIGQLLLGRVAVGIVGAAAVVIVVRLGGPRGPVLGLLVGGIAGAILIVLTAASGHASAFTSPVPVILDVVHVGSGSIWLAGLVTLAALTDFGGTGRLEQGRLRAIVPRFSALALVSVTLIALTGTYADWVQTRDLLAFETPYELNLLVKVLLFALALAIGFLNYLDGGADRRRLGGFSRRVMAELVLGVAVVVATANLTSGSPTALDRPVAMSTAVSTAVSAERVGLGLLPGRPGPQRFVVTLPTPPVEGTTVALTLLRLDASQGRIADRHATGLPDQRAHLRRRRRPARGQPLGRERRRDRPGRRRAGSTALRLRARCRGDLGGTGDAAARPRARGGGAPPRPRTRRGRLRPRRRLAAPDHPGRRSAGPYGRERRRGRSRGRHPGDRWADVSPLGVYASVSPQPTGGGPISLGLVVGIQLLVIALLAAAFARYVGLRRPGWASLARVIGSLAGIAGLVLVVAAILQPEATTIVNPVPNTVTSVEAGAALFQADCARCHGVDARGGGVDAGTTRTTPPSLRSGHLAQHSDGDIYIWISDGLPGGMPAWSGAIPDTARWNLVNYLRSLNGGGPSPVPSVSPSAEGQLSRR